MKYIAILLLLPILAFSQNEKPASPVGRGVSPLPKTKDQQPTANKNTYAVVVGISDYQDPGIPDLRFAHKDAEAFANYLKSTAGGSLDADHLKVLLNEKATVAQFAIALDWLMEVVKENDQVLIYFSGHGDVEKKTITQPGYLLCWDAPSRVYLAGGALALPMFQDIITTLSAQNKAKVVVITDACRSGKLAGSTVGGAQITGANLARQYANEIKILSCQPNEYSIEGEQWGGGRGVFSFNLVDALYGLADGNNDLSVTLQEVGRYLEDKVTAEVAPVSQVPMVLGNRSERLATVDDKLLAALRSGKTNQMLMLSPVETRGMEDDVLVGVDTTTRELYRLFKKALKDKVFLEPSAEGGYADAYYERLMAEPKMQRLHTTMTRNYAAALQDDAQQAINIWLAADVQQLECIGKTLRLDPIPRQLQRAAELLGEGHYMYRSLQARKLLFEGISEMKHRKPDEALGRKCLSIFWQSLALEPQSPLPWHRMSMVYATNLRQPDSAFVCARKAREFAPNWVLPFVDLGYELPQQRKLALAKQALEEAEAIDPQHPYVVNRWARWLHTSGGIANLEKAAALFGQYRESGGLIYPCWFNDYGLVLESLDRHAESEALYKEAIALDSTNSALWNNLGSLYSKTRRYAEAEMVLNKSIALDSTIAATWNNLGLVYHQTRRYAEAEMVLKKSIGLDSTYIFVRSTLGYLYYQTRRYAEAEAVLKKSIALDSTYAIAWVHLGDLYHQTRRFAEAEAIFKKVIALDSLESRSWDNLGKVCQNTGRYAEAEQHFKKAISLDSTFATHWNNLGAMYNQIRRYAEAEPVLKRAIVLDSTLVSSLNNLGFMYLQTRRYAEAEPVFKKAIALDPAYANPRKHLGMVCFKTNRPEEARQNFLKAIVLNPNYAPAMLGMAYLLHSEGKTDEAPEKSGQAFGYVEQAIAKGTTMEQLEKDEDLVPLRAQKEQWDTLMKKHFAKQFYYNLACEQSLKGELEHAFESLELSLTNGWKDYAWMQQDTDLAKMREQANRWKALMKKHFPNQFKD